MLEKDISKWNTINVSDMSYMFDGCSSLMVMPKISKWDITNLRNMSNMFNGCREKIIPLKFRKKQVANIYKDVVDAISHI